MEKIRLKAARRRRHGYRYCVELFYLSGRPTTIRPCVVAFGRKFPGLYKKIKAADGKCIDIEITIREVK